MHGRQVASSMSIRLAACSDRVKGTKGLTAGLAVGSLKYVVCILASWSRRFTHAEQFAPPDGTIRELLPRVLQRTCLTCQL